MSKHKKRTIVTPHLRPIIESYFYEYSFQRCFGFHCLLSNCAGPSVYTANTGVPLTPVVQKRRGKKSKAGSIEIKKRLSDEEHTGKSSDF